MKTLAASLSILLLATAATAQLTVPRASPRVAVEQEVGLATVTLDYSRPGVKGREVFGDVVPYSVVWRTGANASTKMSFDHDVRLGGEEVPAGTYALYTIPTPTTWTVILSRDTTLWGSGGYDPANDQLRIERPVTRLRTPCETFTIDFRDFHTNGAELFLRWADVEVAMPLFTDSEALVLAQIEEHVENATGEIAANTYFDAAKFYVEREIDLHKAATWVEKAVEQRPDAFWMVYYRAELAQTLGDHATARTWATRARDTASRAENDYGYAAKSKALLDELESAGQGL